MEIKILYDNRAKKGFESGWGFSCLAEGKILFDTGCDGPALLRNMKRMGVEISNIRYVVLSHNHWDHVGGLFSFLEQNSKVKVFALKTFSQHMKDEISKRAELIEADKPQRITDFAYTTGLIPGSTDEQSLVLKTEKGVIVIVGCSHPGVDKILAEAGKHGKIRALIGGLHGFSDLDALKGIEVLGPCHCTQKMIEIKKAFPKQFIRIEAGQTIKIT